MIDRYRLCRQAGPGGRAERAAPTAREIALFRLREQAMSFPSIQSRVIEDGAVEDEEAEAGE